MSQKTCNKSKKYQQRQQHQQQRGGVKSSVLTTLGTYVHTHDDSIIIPKLFSDCNKFEIISADSGTGFIFALNSPENSKIRLESSVVDIEGEALPQMLSKDREYSAGTGILLSKCCVKISLVDSGPRPRYFDYFNDKGIMITKSSVTRTKAMREADIQKQIYEASVCEAGVHGVFIPDVIAQIVMNPTEFSDMIRHLLPAAATAAATTAAATTAAATTAATPTAAATTAAATAATPTAAATTAETVSALEWIKQKATSFNCKIHVFCMELIGSTGHGEGEFKTFGEFCNETWRANPDPKVKFPPDAISVACKVGAAVISTLVKSSYWSYDTHPRNIMTNKKLVFLLDFGNMYHITHDYMKIRGMFVRLLEEKQKLVCDFFDATNVDALENFSQIWKKYADPSHKHFTFNLETHHDEEAKEQDIDRVHSNIFELLSLLALIDGMTILFSYGSSGFQCSRYMSIIFSSNSTFDTLDMFLTNCASTWVEFKTVCPRQSVQVKQNMHTIAISLQDALVPCAEMGKPIRPDELRRPPSGAPLSPDTISAQQAMMDAADEEDATPRVKQRATTKPPKRGSIQLPTKAALDKALIADAIAQANLDGGGKLKKTVSKPKRQRTNAKCRVRLRYAQKRRRTRRRGYSSKSRGV